MGFKSLFKVRKPGHGDKVQKGFEKATAAKVSISNKGKDIPNGGDKKGVK